MPGDDWPAYTHLDRAVMVFDRRSHVIHDPHAARRVAWQGFSLAHGRRTSCAKSGDDCVIG